MSIFLELPTDFPLNVDLTDRPVTYHLQVNRGEAITDIIISFILLIAGAALINYLVTNPLFAGGLILAYLIMFGIYHVGEQFINKLSRISVTITDDEVKVTKSSPFGTRKWSNALDDFEGLVLQRHGNHTLGSEKIYMSAVLLKHRDPALSVPLIMREQKNIGKKTLLRMAKESGLPIYKKEEIIISDTEEFPPGTILINQAQATKVYLLYLITMAGGALAILWCLYEMFSAGTILGWAIAASAFAAALMAIMQIYAARYVVALRIDDDHFWLTTISLKMPEQKISRQLVRGVIYKKGRFSTGVAHMNPRMRVNAPWFKLRIKGYRLPFIIDKQAEYVNEKLLMKLRRSQQYD